MACPIPARKEPSLALRAILFDKDGTFVDFHATWAPAIAAAMRTMADGDEDAFARLAAANLFDPATGRLDPASPFIAEASADFARRWAEALRVPLTEEFHRRMDRLLDAGALANVAPVGQPAQVFRTLAAAGYRLGVVTNDTEGGARAQCSALGLSGHLDAIIGYDSGHGRKPGPGQILAFAAQFGLDPGEIAMVGDTRHDLVAARAAGVLAIAVLTGFATSAELASHADHILDDISHLPGLLKQL